MKKGLINAKRKVDCLRRFLKMCAIRNPDTLKLIVSLWNSRELLDKGFFTPYPVTVSHKPILFICHDDCKKPTKLRNEGTIIEGPANIVEALHQVDSYLVYFFFPGGIIPGWYLNVCEPAPCNQTEMVPKPRQPERGNELVFEEVYKQALMVLIDGALERRDRELFLALSEEWNRIA